ncbi:MAG: Hpt domain-containing protein [Nitrospira sp.]|nr:MAG: Hpt domain-containing protein [Nitrospira sp.]
MSDEGVFNLAEALTRVDEDEDLFQTLAELFIEQAPLDMAATQAALDAGDGEALARAAHRMKGAILQFSAPALFEATKQLETLGKAGTVDDAKPVCARVTQELQKLMTALSEYVAHRPAA